jgi:hypothetical protein
LITVTWQNALVWILAVCGGFSTICVAGGWLIKIIKSLKKPSEDIHDALDDDKKRIRELEKQFGFVLKAISLLLQDDLVILNHLRTDNNTGEMSKQEAKVQEFLIKRD